MGLINTGTAANDGTGDKLRDAFVKINAEAIKTMKDKGSITDIANINETGIYAGLDVANSPVTGGIMIMANKDSHGNLGFFLMGEDRAFHTGGKAAAETAIVWAEVQAKPVAEGTVSINPSYGGGFTVIEFPTFTAGATIDLGDGAEHKVIFDLKATADWTAGTDPRGWYLDNHSVLGQVQGVNGVISPVTLKQWVDHGNIVTIKLDATNKLLHVLKVEGDTAVTHSTPILADGAVDMDDNYDPTTPGAVMTLKTTEKFIREFRTTVVQAVAGNDIAKAECITAFKQLPHFDWAKDDDFYVKDATGKVHYFLIKYRANGDTTEAGTNYMFWTTKLKAAT